MKRLVWGIVIAAFGVLGILVECLVPPPPDTLIISLGGNPDDIASGVILASFMIAGGGVMIFFGSRYIRRSKAVAEIVFQMLRQDGKIHAGDLANRLGFSEVDVRAYIIDSQKKGLVPVKADIV